jgi:hypothetical protein
MRRILSGACIHVLPLVTIKNGPKCGAQGKLMERIKGPVPKIYLRWKTGYMMETLQPLGNPWYWRTNEKILHEYVWKHNEAPMLGRQPRFDYTKTLYYLESMRSPLLQHHALPKYAHMNRVYSHATEWTHGDPTHENTMQKNGIYRLLDWQSDRANFRPAHRDADYGRLLQSLFGWNNVNATNEDFITQAKFLMRERRMAWFWCCFNFERIREKADFLVGEWCRVQQDRCLHMMERL